MKYNKVLINIYRVIILITFLILWETLSRLNIINSFIFSSPSKVFNCLINLIKSQNLFNHVIVTLNEVIVSFSLSIFISFFVAIILYELPYFFKIIEPYLTILNSMPKVAIGPLIIILFGAGIKSIIIMSLSITLIINILSIYNGFINSDEYLVKYLKSLGANRYQIIKYLIIPSSINTITNSLKINISMTLIGVIMGEFLVSKAGIGYLIIYGSQVFNLTLVMTGIFLLMIISYILYIFIDLIEKNLNKKNSIS